MIRGKNKILLYNAIQTAFASSDISPSFSLMALSAFLKEKGYQTELLLNNYSELQLKNTLKDCLAVGFSLYTGGSRDALKIAARIKALAPEIPLVWGGYHPTLEAGQSLRNKNIHYVVRGQGEITFLELLKHFEEPKEFPLENIRGLSYKINGKIFHNEIREAVSIETFPLFDYELYDHVFKKASAIGYISSRGCPFACKFCCSASFNRSYGMRFYQLSLDRVLADLESLIERYNPKKIDFLDDNFFVNPERIRLFVKEYKKRNFKFKWTAFGRCQFFADTDEELVAMLSSIGLERVFFGVESGSQRILDMVNKVMKVEQVISALEKIKRHSILGDFTFINGFPNERRGDILKSIRLRNQIKALSPLSTVRFFVYTPLPGTEMLDECIKMGYKKPKRVKDWKSYEYHTFDAPWLSADYRKFVHNISWAALFSELLPGFGTNFLTKIIFRLLIKDSEWRFRHETFGFAPELVIINSLYGKKLIHG